MSAFFCAEVESAERRADATNAVSDILTAKVDDGSLRYLLAVHPAFESFRAAASQLAGLLVLVAAGAKGGAPDAALLKASSLSYAEALDTLRGLLATERVRHLHHHLREAAAGVGAALAAAERQVEAAPRAFEVAAVLAPLSAAYQHLQFASRLAPGFRLVETRDSCCGLTG
jgi:hypothetical protein